jgi:hypothetical protein
MRTWHRATVSVDADFTFTLEMDGVAYPSFTDPSPATNLAEGFVALGTGWHHAQFDEVDIQL